jgi:hypothetical protein
MVRRWARRLCRDMRNEDEGGQRRGIAVLWLRSGI